MNKKKLLSFNLSQNPGYAIDILNTLPAMVAWKNERSIFLGGNMQAAKYAGFKSALDMEGISDYDLKSPVVEYADQFIAQDKSVIKDKKTINILGIHTYDDCVTRILMTSKSPLIEQTTKQIVGTLYHSNIITNEFLVMLSIKLLKMDYTFSTFKKSKQQCYQVNSTYDHYRLTARESECLFYLMRGQKISRIARFLDISARTVETHIEHIKVKMGCNFLSQIIERAITDGYLFMIPEALFKHQVF